MNRSTCPVCHADPHNETIEITISYATDAVKLYAQGLVNVSVPGYRVVSKLPTTDGDVFYLRRNP